MENNKEKKKTIIGQPKNGTGRQGPLVRQEPEA